MPDMESPSNAERNTKKLLLDVVNEKRTDSRDDSDNHSAVGSLLMGDTDGEDGHDTSSLSYKYVMELIDQYVFVEAENEAKKSYDQGCDLDRDAISAICDKAFVDAVGRDMFLQILDDKRGRNAVLGERSFDAMAIAMKVILVHGNVLAVVWNNFSAWISVCLSSFAFASSSCAVLGVSRQVLPE